MIAQLLYHQLDHSHFESVKPKNIRNLRNFRFYIDFKFGHGFWHTLVQTHNYIGHMYMHNFDLDDKLLSDLISIIAKIVNLDENYLFEEFNLYVFKISAKKS